MPGDRPTISTHVLDTGTGLPAAGRPRHLRSLLEGDRRPGGRWRRHRRRRPDPRRARGTVARRRRLPPSFELGAARFFEAVTVDVRIEDASRSYHVPLLVAPFGLSSYRGS